MLTWHLIHLVSLLYVLYKLVSFGTPLNLPDLHLEMSLGEGEPVIYVIYTFLSSYCACAHLAQRETGICGSFTECRNVQQR